jgi:hypothetical protein
MADPDHNRGEAPSPEAHFVPKGALAFMAVMIAAYGAVWLFFYFLLVRRP